MGWGGGVVHLDVSHEPTPEHGLQCDLVVLQQREDLLQRPEDEEIGLVAGAGVVLVGVVVEVVMVVNLRRR